MKKSKRKKKKDEEGDGFSPNRRNRRIDRGNMKF
jgi:hypothetical protein